MRIRVYAKAGAKEEKLVPPELKLLPDEMPVYKVHVKEPAKEGQANDAIARVLANHFGVSYSEVRLVSGATAKYKVFKVLG